MPQANALDLVGDQFDLISWGSEVAVQSFPAPPKAMRMRWVQTSSLPTAPCSTTCIIAPNQRAKAIGTASLFTALYSQTSSTAANKSFLKYVLLHTPTRWTWLGTSSTSFLGVLKSVLAVLPAAVQSPPAPPKAMRMRWVQTSSLPTAPCSTTCIIAPDQRAKAIGTASLFTALYSQTSSTAANESFLKYVLLHMPTRWTSLGTSLTSFLGVLKSVLAVLPAAVQSPPAPPKAMRTRWVQTSSLPTAPCSTTCIIAPDQRAKAIGTASLFTALYSQTSSTAANESFFRYVLLHSWHHFQPP